VTFLNKAYVATRCLSEVWLF